MQKAGPPPDFRAFCEKAIANLTIEDVDSFKSAKDDISRIRIMQDIAKLVSIGIPEDAGKDYMVAESKKSEGNQLFGRKDYKNALKCYNEGIIKCPQETVKDRELLTILVSNRSATNFELQKYRRVLDDIDYITEIGDYPNHLHYKLWLRKARCYDELQNKKLANEAYDEAENSLKNSKLDEKSVEDKMKEIEKFRKQGSRCVNPKQKKQLELEPVFFEERFRGGDEFVAAIPKIAIQQDSYQGRYAMAIEDIPAGTTLVEETPYCSVVDSNHALTNCQNCLASVELAIACPNCSDIIFCSTHCSRMATKTFHGIECGYQKVLFKNGASVNCLMALRIITQKPLKFFLDKRNKLKDYMKDSCKKNVVRKKVYRSDDYDNLFFLCRNETLRIKEELVHYASIAISLVNILKLSGYFGDKKQDVLSEDEIFIGALILRHLQILQFNAHELSELQNCNDDVNNNDIFVTGYENAAIGAGVYPTLAMFNHSCDPSVIRYNIRNKMIVKAIKPIKADDIIYENYGPLYMSEPLESRQAKLKENYYFECLCQPCMEMWPLFKEMNEAVLRIPCITDGCPFTFTVDPADDPFLNCPYCHNTTGIFPNLKGLMKLEEILPEAEHLLSLHQFDNASKKFFEALELLYKYSRAPHPDFVKVQQRIRVCLLHFGNKAYDYEPKL
ncbi:SET and MYND domain-containing protein DDB_G0284059-like isoform X1 [Sitophilus oryzae]|uniref:Protein-lysine N-methyltransferase SMYD4 n=1 Tax=Sitophilus oryzae TaxID=7048 RepID=A0A6J2XMK0_SITOR|nr:SET and MYND domain-containing protein DDB_G0284059-like isoform X1 [Sitophilus oryzae]